MSNTEPDLTVSGPPPRRNLAALARARGPLTAPVNDDLNVIEPKETASEEARKSRKTRPTKAQPASRITTKTTTPVSVQVPNDTVSRSKAAFVATATYGDSYAGFVARALDHYTKHLESTINNGQPFPPYEGKLKTGPRGL